MYFIYENIDSPSPDSVLICEFHALLTLTVNALAAFVTVFQIVYPSPEGLPTV